LGPNQPCLEAACTALASLLLLPLLHQVQQQQHPALLMQSS
jgi:hypothetical protein